MTEEQLLEFEDCLVNLNSQCEQYGAREVFKAFRQAYPDMFEEIAAQIVRLKSPKQIPALFRALPSV